MPNFKYDMDESKPEIYALKHKDLDVALVHVNTVTGTIEYVLEVYLPDELPVGCLSDGTFVREWWRERAIPETRRGIMQVLNYLKEPTNQSLMLSGYGLGLTDHYWLQPLDKELYWQDINYFQNAFSDDLGDLLTDTGAVNFDDKISRFSPSSSVNGEMKKKWVIRNGVRHLMKVNFNDYGQQAVNEVIAGELYKLSGWTNYVPYLHERAKMGGKEYPCSLSPLFTSNEKEFVPAYQLIRNVKIRNDSSSYEAIISQAVLNGILEIEVRRQLEYTILTDFLLSNTDRHFNNFGFMRNAETGRLFAMAPIFDTGNSLFYNQEFIPAGEHLLELRTASFCKREVDLLRYVKDYSLVNLESLKGFPDKVSQLLSDHTDMPRERAEKIAGTVEQKLQFLDKLYHGKKIWKKEQYR